MLYEVITAREASVDERAFGLQDDAVLGHLLRRLPEDLVADPDELGFRVITSYSIHYTKLYDGR